MKMILYMTAAVLFLVGCGDHQLSKVIDSSPSIEESPQLESEVVFEEKKSEDSSSVLEVNFLDDRLGYYKDIRPLFDRKCSVCHSEASRLRVFDTYEDVYKLRGLILDRVILNSEEDHGMQLGSDERELINHWLESGAPEGEWVDSEDIFLPEIALLSFDYERDIAPIFKRSCSLCHNSSSKLGDWQNYAEVYFKRESIYERVIEHLDMPPKGSPSGALKQTERKLIEVWLDSLSLDDAPEDPFVGLPIEPVSFEPKVRKILKKRCVSCHNSNSSIPNWLDYKTSFSGRSQIHLRVFIKGDMPPSSSNTDRLKPDEASLLMDWIASGAGQ